MTDHSEGDTGGETPLTSQFQDINVVFVSFQTYRIYSILTCFFFKSTISQILQLQVSLKYSTVLRSLLVLL